MMVRMPVVAGQFYPDSEQACRQELSRYIPAELDESQLPRRIVAGIVPHAGWVCSGAVAGKVFKAISLRAEPATFVLFGAVHTYGVNTPAIFAAGCWESPLGRSQIDQRLAQRILASTNLIEDQPYAHEYEHSLEVQVPFIQQLFPQARIVPILVPPDRNALQVGKLVAQTIQTYKADAVCIGSTDLTHYGPRYGFTPKGTGISAIEWAKTVNDRALLDLIVAFEAEQITTRARSDQSACGAGAIAATVAAARQLSAQKAVILEHTSSYEVLRGRYPDAASDSVGYAGIVFGMD